LVVLRVLALVFLIGRLPPDISGHYVANDALRYQQIATTPGTPYRDFPVEVPPAELAELKLLAGPDPRTTAITLAWFQLVLDLVALSGLLYGWGEDAGIGYLLISLPLVPFIYFRIDLLSVALGIWAMALLQRRIQTASGWLLAAAVMAKLWPLALLPAYAMRRAWRGLAWASALVATTWLAWVGWVGLQGPREVLTFRGAVGWQIESLPGALEVLVTKHPVIFDGGALRVGYAAPPARSLMLAVSACFVAGAWFLSWRRGDPRLGLPALASVGAMLVFSPILSWQYVIWLAPWAALTVTEGEWVASALTLAISAMTSWMIFQSIPLSMRSGLAEFVVNARNLLLLVLVAWCLSRLLSRRPSPEEASASGIAPSAIAAGAATLD
jgi:hypothetical protein